MRCDLTAISEAPDHSWPQTSSRSGWISSMGGAGSAACRAAGYAACRPRRVLCPRCTRSMSSAASRFFRSSVRSCAPRSKAPIRVAARSCASRASRDPTSAPLREKGARRASTGAGGAVLVAMRRWNVASRQQQQWWTRSAALGGCAAGRMGRLADGGSLQPVKPFFCCQSFFVCSRVLT
jgi:hypothetical protein